MIKQETRQEAHHLILRLATMANPTEGIMTGPMADAHIGGYQAQGWRVHTCAPGAIDQGTSAMVVFYLLVRDVPVQDVTMGVDKASKELSRTAVVAGEQLATKESSWDTPNVESVPV